MLKIGIEESVLLFWESVLVGHLRDSFVLTESFANRPCLVVGGWRVEVLC